MKFRLGGWLQAEWQAARAAASKHRWLGGFMLCVLIIEAIIAGTLRLGLEVVIVTFCAAAYCLMKYGETGAGEL